jgi:hypothetical protein
MIVGYSPVEHFQIYGGPVYQTVKANLGLRGNAYTQAFNGYNAKFQQEGEVGWLLGGSYQLPDLALKAAITYRSKIKYKFQVDEDIYGEPLKLVENEKTKLETPASLNIDFQTNVLHRRHGRAIADAERRGMTAGLEQRIEITELFYEKDDVIYPHSGLWGDFNFCLNGILEYEAAGQIHWSPPSYGLWLPPHTAHHSVALDEHTTHYVAVRLDPALCRGFSAQVEVLSIAPFFLQLIQETLRLRQQGCLSHYRHALQMVLDQRVVELLAAYQALHEEVTDALFFGFQVGVVL